MMRAVSLILFGLIASCNMAIENRSSHTNQASENNGRLLDTEIVAANRLCKSYRSVRNSVIFQSLLGNVGGCFLIQGEGFDEILRRKDDFLIGSSVLPVLTYEKRGLATKGIVLLLFGGPRRLNLDSRIAEGLAEDGFYVVAPVYQGQATSNHPSPDLPGAIRQVQDLVSLYSRRISGVVGISAGAYVAAAACDDGCPGSMVLVAPPLESPANWLDRNRTPIAPKIICLSRAVTDRNHSNVVCDTELSLFKSFWGRGYWSQGISSILKSKQNTYIIVSKNDNVIYNKDFLNSIDIPDRRKFVLESPTHAEMDGDRSVTGLLIKILNNRL